jgi:hypothetical protein
MNLIPLGRPWRSRWYWSGDGDDRPADHLQYAGEADTIKTQLDLSARRAAANTELFENLKLKRGCRRMPLSRI